MSSIIEFLQATRPDLATALTNERLGLAGQVAQLRKERDQLKARLDAMFPLFQDARDALTSIPLSSAKLHRIPLDLADRMDDVGAPSRWANHHANPHRQGARDR